MSKLMTGKVVVITGASAGVGRATAPAIHRVVMSYSQNCGFASSSFPPSRTGAIFVARPVLSSAASTARVR